MKNRLWKVPLGLVVLFSAGLGVGIEPFVHVARSVSAQERSQDAAQTITGRLSAESEMLEDGSYYNVHVFDAEAGQTFRIEMISNEFDTYLMVFDAEGNKLAENNDGENGTHAQVSVTVPATGQYGIIANSLEAGETGDYTLTIQAIQVETIDQDPSQSSSQIEADRLFSLGLEQYNRSQFREAIASWQSALELYRAIEDVQGEASSLRNIGAVYFSLGQYREAIDHYEQSLKVFQAIEDVLGEAGVLNNLGLVYFSLGQYREAIAYYEKTLEISQAIEYLLGESAALNNLGNVYDSLGQYREAIAYREQALEIFQIIENRLGEADSLMNLGISYRNLGQYREAIAYYEQSLEIFRAVANAMGEANSLGNLGNAYDSLGQYREAIAYHEQSLELSRAIEDVQGEANSLGNLGNAYDSLGQYREAIAYHEQSLELSRAIEDVQGEANSLMNLGNVYLDLGQYQEAIAYYEQSLETFQVVEDVQGEVDSLNNLGLAYDSLGQYQEAIAYHEQSLELSRAIEDVQGGAASLNNLGLAYNSLGQYQEAIAYYEQSLETFQVVKDVQGEASSLMNLGNVYRNLGQYQEAIAYYDQSLEIFRTIEDVQGESNSLINLGGTFLETHQYSEAEQTLLSTVEILELLRNSELPDMDKVALFETQRGSYMLLQQALVAQNKTNAALEIAERSRARALVELIANQVSARTTEDVAVTSPSLAKVQQIAQQQNTTLVSYSIVNLDISDPLLYIWVIPPTGEISFEEIDLTTLDRPLSELVAVSRNAIGVRGIDIVFDGDLASVPSLEDQQHQRQTQQQNLKQLYDILIAPIANQLPTDANEKVIFIPQGDLFLVPFAALIDENGQYLIENHTISIAPSIQTLELTHQLSSSTISLTANPLIVGNPTMPKLWNPDSNTDERLPALIGAENEAEAIAQQLNTKALLWDNASETVVAAQMPSASLIHFATHGLLDYGTPEESGVRDVPGAIALAPDSTNDGILTSAEIFEMQLQAELVVLSACNTGRGTITGDGVIGLSRSLMQAGVPSVVVSLWSVPDDSTEFLMTEFYANLNTMDKTQALRQAMLTTMRNPEYTEPLDWAAFTLVGEPE